MEFVFAALLFEPDDVSDVPPAWDEAGTEPDASAT
jgi:hypothetical protein